MNEKQRKFNVWAGRILMFAVFVALCGVSFDGHAEVTADSAMPKRAASDVLMREAVEFWRQMNVARRDPLAAAARLGISEQVVRETFAGQEWILEAGLPPLAWSESLVMSASAHGEDMFSREYYSYTSPEGETYWDRIESVGCSPALAGETMNALFFENLISVEDASSLLMDAVLRDELTGSPSVECNIFNPELSQVGIEFLAGNVLLADGLPYAYLMVADFSSPQPENARPAIVGSYPPGYGVILHPLVGGWLRVDEINELSSAPEGVFQVPCFTGGVDLILIDNYGLGFVSDIITLYDETVVQDGVVGLCRNRFVELGVED